MKNSDIKKRNLRVLFLCVVLCVLPVFMLTGCSDEAGDRLVDVNFGVDDGVSRNIFSSFGSVVAPEDCFWTYTAIKTDGYYTTGASEKNSSGKLIEKRVSDVKGLSGVSRKFSQGKWTFSIFGYADENCTQLIYTAEKSNVSFTSASQTVLFSLKNSTESGLTFTTTDLASSADKTFSSDGVLALGRFVLIVPDGLTLRIDSTVLAEIFDGSDGLIASSSTVVHSDRGRHLGLTLSPFSFVDGKEAFTAGTHIFTIKITYSRAPYLDETSVEPIVATGSMRVPFVSGSVTSVFGSLDNLTWSMERSLIGGQIFYVGPDNGARYRFFDCMGRELTTFTVEGLRSAYSYTVEGFTDSMADRFYVCNKEMCVKGPQTSSMNCSNVSAQDSYVGNDGKIYRNKFVSRVYWDIVDGQTNDSKDIYNLFYDGDSLGCGKSNTAYFMNLCGTVAGSSMRADEHVKNSNTVWYHLANKINKAGVSTNTTGLYDWYVPSITELIYLARYDSSVLSFSGGSSNSSTLTDVGVGGICYPGSYIAKVISYRQAGCNGRHDAFHWVFIRSF